MILHNIYYATLYFAQNPTSHAAEQCGAVQCVLKYLVVRRALKRKQKAGVFFEKQCIFI